MMPDSQDSTPGTENTPGDSNPSTASASSKALMASAVPSQASTTTGSSTVAAADDSSEDEQAEQKLTTKKKKKKKKKKKLKGESGLFAEEEKEWEAMVATATDDQKLNFLFAALKENETQAVLLILKSINKDCLQYDKLLKLLLKIKSDAEVIIQTLCDKFDLDKLSQMESLRIADKYGDTGEVAQDRIRLAANQEIIAKIYKKRQLIFQQQQLKEAIQKGEASTVAKLLTEKGITNFTVNNTPLIYWAMGLQCNAKILDLLVSHAKLGRKGQNAGDFTRKQQENLLIYALAVGADLTANKVLDVIDVKSIDKALASIIGNTKNKKIIDRMVEKSSLQNLLHITYLYKISLTTSNGVEDDAKFTEQILNDICVTNIENNKKYLLRVLENKLQQYLQQDPSPSIEDLDIYLHHQPTTNVQILLLQQRLVDAINKYSKQAKPYLQRVLQHNITIGNFALVRYLLELGVDPRLPNLAATAIMVNKGNEESLFKVDFYCLCMAALLGHIENVKLLLNHGVPIDIIATPIPADVDNNSVIRVGLTILGVGADSKLSNEEQESLFRDYEAAQPVPSAPNFLTVHFESGSAPLLLAAKSGHALVVKYLLDEKASVNVVDRHGFTPLMYAIKAKHYDVVNILIAYHADVEVANYKGETALSLARRDSDLLEIIIEAKEKQKLREQQSIEKALTDLGTTEIKIEDIQTEVEQKEDDDAKSEEKQTMPSSAPATSQAVLVQIVTTRDALHPLNQVEASVVSASAAARRNSDAAVKKRDLIEGWLRTLNHLLTKQFDEKNIANIVLMRNALLGGVAALMRAICGNPPEYPFCPNKFAQKISNVLLKPHGSWLSHNNSPAENLVIFNNTKEMVQKIVEYFQACLQQAIPGRQNINTILQKINSPHLTDLFLKYYRINRVTTPDCYIQFSLIRSELRYYDQVDDVFWEEKNEAVYNIAMAYTSTRKSKYVPKDMIAGIQGEEDYAALLGLRDFKSYEMDIRHPDSMPTAFKLPVSPVPAP